MGLFKFYWTDATNELKTSVSDGKTAIAAAVTDKGVNTAASDSFSTMASNIGAIPTGTDTSDATATAAKILSGYTAYAKGVKLTGTASGAPTDAYISDCPSFIYNTYVSLSGSTLTFGGVANRANSQFEISIKLI